MDKINVLSLFDGISCGRVALNRAGVSYSNYFASEIDKYAIKVAQKNYSDTIQLGDIISWRDWNLPTIDLLIGGSPCQGFSNAGDGLNFSDPRSKLFFEFVNILKYLKPKFFLLENVKMKKEWQDIISEKVGVQPILINSSLVSAQNRKRLYWTNIPNITQPEDKHIFLKDILEYTNSIEANKIRNKSKSIRVGGRSSPANSKQEWDNVYIQGAAIRNQVTKRGIEEQLNIRKDEKSNCVVPTYPNKLNGVCIQVGEADIKGFDIVKRVYSPEGKSPSLTTMQGDHREPKVSEDNITWRKFTPIECERLQTLEDNFTEGISNSQRYKCLGNGWTVDVIAHIFSFMKF
jgi:DNA-methyltransferase (dcm)